MVEEVKVMPKSHIDHYCEGCRLTALANLCKGNTNRMVCPLRHMNSHGFLRVGGIFLLLGLAIQPFLWLHFGMGRGNGSEVIAKITLLMGRKDLPKSIACLPGVQGVLQKGLPNL